MDRVAILLAAIVALPAAAYLTPSTSVCGRGSLDANCNVRSGSGLATDQTGAVTLAQPAVVAVTSTTPSHLVQAMTDGTQSDRGIPNRVGNISYVDVPASGAAYPVPTGVQLVRFIGSGTVANQPVQMPAAPQDGDQVVFSTAAGLTITSLPTVNAAGTTITTGVMLRPLTQMVMLYDAALSAWVPRSLPATLYNDVQAVAAGQAAGFITASGAPVQSVNGQTGTVTVPTLTSAQAASAAPVQSVAGRTGAVTLTAFDVSGLGSAASQPSSAFDAAGLAATETTRAQAAEALKAPLASPALTGTPTVPTAAVGTNTTQAASTAFVAAAQASLPWQQTGKATVTGNIAAVTALGLGIYQPAITLTVTGATLGEDVRVVFAGAPPTGLTLSNAQVTAANTVQVFPVSTQAVSLAAQTGVSFNVYRDR